MHFNFLQMMTVITWSYALKAPKFGRVDNIAVKFGSVDRVAAGAPRLGRVVGKIVPRAPKLLMSAFG